MWEAAVNVGHVSGLLPLLRLSVSPPQLWCLQTTRIISANFSIHHSAVIPNYVSACLLRLVMGLISSLKV